MAFPGFSFTSQGAHSIQPVGQVYGVHSAGPAYSTVTYPPPTFQFSQAPSPATPAFFVQPASAAGTPTYPPVGGFYTRRNRRNVGSRRNGCSCRRRRNGRSRKSYRRRR